MIEIGKKYRVTSTFIAEQMCCFGNAWEPDQVVQVVDVRDDGDVLIEAERRGLISTLVPMAHFTLLLPAPMSADDRYDRCRWLQHKLDDFEHEMLMDEEQARRVLDVLVPEQQRRIARYEAALAALKEKCDEQTE